MYREARTIEAATYLLSKVEKEMPYIKLIKLLYLADREQVKRNGRTISGDTHWSLEYGPILSHTLNAIKGEGSGWLNFIGRDLDARVIWLKAQAKPTELSRADRDVLDSIATEFGHMKWEDLVEYTHQLAEWRKPEGKVKRWRIYLKDIARAVGHSDEKIKQILAADRERGEMQGVMSSFRATHV